MAKTSFKAVIIAGGAGTRMWPASRKKMPKQLLPLIGRKSLLRLSWDRLTGLCKPKDIYVCAASAYRALIRKDLPKLPAANYIGEPEGRDSAAAIGFAAAVLHARDPETVMAVVTADHVIEPKQQFQAAFRTAAKLAVEHDDALIVFGVKPRYPHTGLGYLHRGRRIGKSDPPAFAVRRFKEKPDAATALRYQKAGTYYWNSGMFVWRTATILDHIRRFEPAMGRSIKKFLPDADTPRRTATMKRLYPKLKRISIDFAIMEKAPKVLMVELPCDWHDVGNFAALGEVLPAGPDGSIHLGPRVISLDSRGNIIVGPKNHIVATLGVKDLVIVHTPDATLVCSKQEAVRLKEVVEQVRAMKLDRHL